jgi:aminoglycoside 3-N-acetyltransferase
VSVVVITTDRPLVTVDLLAADFARLGVRAGDTLLVHASMRAIGWICGGPTVVVQALLDAVGPSGTIVVPAQTPYNRDPSHWSHDPIPEEWWPAVRDHQPAFDPALTPSTAMGALAERVRTWPGAARSGHPLTSFAAVGDRAIELMAGHPIQSLLGAESPLGALERADARVLLLGVGYAKCTTFHLAEYRLPDRPIWQLSAVIRTAAGREWVRYESAGLDDHDFGDLGAAFDLSGPVSRGVVGAATSRLFPVREAVRFAEFWMSRHRPPCPPPPAGPPPAGPTSPAGPVDESEYR